MKEKIKGVNELAKKKGIKTHKDSLLKEAEFWKHAEFDKEHELRQLGNKKWRSWKEYDAVCKEYKRFEKEYINVKNKRYEALCAYKGIKPVQDEEEKERQ